MSPNKNYLKGRRKEYAMCRKYEEKGCQIVQRTAGSHSPFDIIAIDTTTKEIFLIQCKPNTMGNLQLQKIEKENKELNDVFQVSFLVL